MERNDFVYYASLVTQIGLTIIFSILAGLFIGIFLDRVCNTKGIFLIMFLIFGIIGGFRSAYKQILRNTK